MRKCEDAYPQGTPNLCKQNSTYPKTVANSIPFPQKSNRHCCKHINFPFKNLFFFHTYIRGNTSIYMYIRVSTQMTSYGGKNADVTSAAIWGLLSTRIYTIINLTNLGNL
jgi:hypothetical protein